MVSLQTCLHNDPMAEQSPYALATTSLPMDNLTP